MKEFFLKLWAYIKRIISKEEIPEDKLAQFQPDDPDAPTLHFTVEPEKMYLYALESLRSSIESEIRPTDRVRQRLWDVARNVSTYLDWELAYQTFDQTLPDTRNRREKMLVLVYGWFLEDLRDRYGRKPLSLYILPDEKWRL